jgi:hypothetical protein
VKKIETLEGTRRVVPYKAQEYTVVTALVTVTVCYSIRLMFWVSDRLHLVRLSVACANRKDVRFFMMNHLPMPHQLRPIHPFLIQPTSPPNQHTRPASRHSCRPHHIPSKTLFQPLSLFFFKLISPFHLAFRLTFPV